MQEVSRRKEVALLGLRARVPYFLRAMSMLLGAAVIYFMVYTLYRSHPSHEFILRQGKAELSTNVTRRVDNYERREDENGHTKLLVRAAVATSFDDGHHELSQVHIEFYPNGGERANKIDAREAIYFNEEETISFTGNVQIETVDQLKVSSEAINYKIKEERGDSQVPLTFSRENIAGRADAADVDGKQKHLVLRGNVEITVSPTQNANAQLKLRDEPVIIHAPKGDFDQLKMHLAFTGGATAEQGKDVMSGDSLAGFLSEKKKIQRIETRGNAYLRSGKEGHAAEVHSVNMDMFFHGETQRLEQAVASENVQARTLDADSEATLVTPTDVQLLFDAQGEQSILKEMRAEGRPVVTLAAPKSQSGNPKAANKRLTANSIHLAWRATGKDLEKAEAVGNAELVVEPIAQTPQADRTVLNAARFDCDFLETGNLARLFTATGGTKTVITPLVASEKRGVRTLTSDTVVAFFTKETQDVEHAETQGNTKFNEGDRNGESNNAVYTAADATVRLRGGDPAFWDSRARIKAAEIDTNTKTKVTLARAHVQTTYYSQEQTNGALPFAKVKSPVFVTSNEAEFQHESGLGIYTGEARAWQDDNFVRADRITLRRDARRMEGEGHVQSALYHAKRREAGGEPTVVPVFASSTRMFYSDTDRVLHYEGSVDIKQGTERITSEVADVFLQKDQGEVDHTIAQRNVVVTQPGKRATGDWGQYVAADETVTLTGNPARVEDAEQGTNEGRRMIVYLRENRVVSDSAATDGGRPTGRVHTVHKIKSP